MLALRKSFGCNPQIVTPLNSEKGFLNVILPIAYSKLSRESAPNKVAPPAGVGVRYGKRVKRSC